MRHSLLFASSFVFATATIGCLPSGDVDGELDGETVPELRSSVLGVAYEYPNIPDSKLQALLLLTSGTDASTTALERQRWLLQATDAQTPPGERTEARDALVELGADIADDEEVWDVLVDVSQNEATLRDGSPITVFDDDARVSICRQRGAPAYDEGATDANRRCFVATGGQLNVTLEAPADLLDADANAMNATFSARVFVDGNTEFGSELQLDGAATATSEANLLAADVAERRQ